MALKFGKAEFVPLEKQRGSPVCTPFPDVLDSCDLQPVNFLSTAESARHFSPLKPMVARLNQSHGVWEAVVNCPDNRSLPSLEGENFVANSNGIFFAKDGKTQGRRISSVNLEIVVREYRWSGKSVREILHIKVTSANEQSLYENIIQVDKQDFKKTFEILRKELPGEFFSSSDLDAKDSYLSTIFQRDAEKADVKYFSDVGGWVEFSNLMPRFYVGDDKFYNEMQTDIPVVCGLNKEMIFVEGSAFRKIGHENVVIELLWLAAHVALSLFWLRKFGVDFRSVIFVKGKTGLFKTTVTSLLANIFAQNRAKVSLRLSSTKASTQEFVTRLPDNLVLLDDFSNTVGANNNSMRDNVETVIRAVGDGMFSGKMNVSNFAECRIDNVRSVIVITGEDELGLSESSLYRLLVLPIVEGTFDPQLLALTSERHEILQRYFALFVQFLTEKGSTVVRECASHFSQYREFFSTKFSAPRFIDVAATLLVEIDLIFEFGIYCGMSTEEMIAYRNHAQNCVVEAIQLNSAASVQSKPEVRFLHALWQSIDNGKYTKIAATEDKYVNDTASFIGFREDSTGTIWVRPDEAYNLVRNFYQRQGEQFLTSLKSIKVLLLQNGLSEGKLVPSNQGSSEYLKKSKKSPRKWFLVLNYRAVEQFLENNKGDLS